MTAAAVAVRLGGYTTLARALRGHFGGRLEQFDDAILELAPHVGSIVEVNGSLVDLTGGIQVGAADNLLAADGTDSGGAAAASTIYHVYVSNAQASFRPSGLGLSATLPQLDANGFRYLNAAGNGHHWRYVGVVRTTAAVEFSDTAAARLIVNWYNRQLKHLRTVPGYVDDDAVTTYTENNAAWAAFARAGNLLEWLGNGQDAYSLTAVGVVQSAASTGRFGLLVSGAGPVVATAVPSGVSGTYVSGYSAAAALGSYVTAELAAFTASGNMVFVADLQRNGAAADPPATLMAGTVWA